MDDLEWRKWNNVHRYDRQGVSLAELTDFQRDAAWGLLRAGLSPSGVEKAGAVMRLNGHLGELTGRPGEYGEGAYFLTVMGTLGQEPLAAQDGRQLGAQHLERHLAVVPHVIREVDHGHAAPPASC